MSMKGEGFVNKAIRGLVFNDKVRILAINSTNLVKEVTKQLQTIKKYMLSIQFQI